MDFSKFKFEVYDILAVVLPGFLLLCGMWVLLRGWHEFTAGLGSLSGSSFTALLLAAFPVGHLIQELGDWVIKKLRGPRFFKKGRDDFWETAEGLKVSEFIEQEIGCKVSVDSAFDFCLTKIKAQFPKRDVFLATSDFCRSLLVVGVLLIAPSIRLIRDLHGTCLQITACSGGIAAALVLWIYLAERRMVRFRALSEVPVFNTYLACVKASVESKTSDSEAKD